MFLSLGLDFSFFLCMSFILTSLTIATQMETQCLFSLDKSDADFVFPFNMVMQQTLPSLSLKGTNKKALRHYSTLQL